MPKDPIKTPGELVSAPDYALSFRLLEPASEAPRRLLLLLHGWDADELQFADLAARVDDATRVVLPRGPRSAGDGTFGWYRVSFDGGEPEALADEVEDSQSRLIKFIGQLQSRHAVAADSTVVAGFSQGGALAASAVLVFPRIARGFAMFSGRLLPQVEAQARGEALSSPLEVFLAHGRDDKTLDVDLARRADRWLRERGAHCELHLHGGGHALSNLVQDGFLAWYGAPARPWNA